jgi:hypothetical protein
MEKVCLMPATPHARRQGYSCAKVLLIPFLLGLLTSLLWRYAMYPKYGPPCFEGHHIFWCQSILHGQPKKVIKSKNSAPRNDKLKK